MVRVNILYHYFYWQNVKQSLEKVYKKVLTTESECDNI